MKFIFLSTFFLIMYTNPSQSQASDPVKIPQDLLSIVEKNTEDLMNNALTGNGKALGNVRRTLQLSLDYRGTGAPYFSSPHKASKQILLWYIISALTGDKACISFLESGIHHGFNYNYDKEEACETYYINDYMIYFILSNSEKKHYEDMLKIKPNHPYANYLLYMDARQRNDPNFKKYLKNIKGIVSDDLSSKQAIIDAKEKKINIANRKNN